MTHNTTPRPTRQAVLVVLNSDGFVEAYADQSLVDVHIVNKPAMTSNAGQILAEQYLETEIPRRHREIYFPGNLVDTNQVRTRTPDDIADRETGLALCNVRSEIGKESKVEVAEWVA